MDNCIPNNEMIWILTVKLYKNGREALFVPQTFVSKSKDKLVDIMKNIRQDKYEEIKQKENLELCGIEIDPNNNFVYIECYNKVNGVTYELRCNLYDSIVV